MKHKFLFAIIDDCKINNFINKKLLTELCPTLEVFSFDNPVKGLEFVLKKVDNNMVLILDLSMPVIDGWTILELLSLKKLEIPTLIVSSSINIEDKEKAKLYDFVLGYIEKPLSIEKIKSIVTNDGNVKNKSDKITNILSEVNKLIIS